MAETGVVLCLARADIAAAVWCRERKRGHFNIMYCKEGAEIFQERWDKECTARISLKPNLVNSLLTEPWAECCFFIFFFFLYQSVFLLPLLQFCV